VAGSAFPAGTAGPRYGDSAPDVEFRLSSAYTRPNLVRFIVFGSLAALFGFGWSRNPFTTFIVATTVFGVLAVYHGVAYCWRRRFRTRLTTPGIEIRGYFNHFVPWDDVRSIEVGGYGGSRRIDDDLSTRSSFTRGGSIGRRARLGIVYVVRSGGRKMLLRAPLVTSWAPDPYFEQKARQLQELCGQYGTRPLA
jgi:hypothetical protein